MDILTTLTVILTAGKVTHTMDISWFWVLAPLYLRFSAYVVACFCDMGDRT